MPKIDTKVFCNVREDNKGNILCIPYGYFQDDDKKINVFECLKPTDKLEVMNDVEDHKILHTSRYQDDWDLELTVDGYIKWLKYLNKIYEERLKTICKTAIPDAYDRGELE